MQRQAEHWLLEWKLDSSRLPLILRGARQVGKSTLVERFGAKHFQHTIIVDFELQPQFKACFDRDLDPQHIISQIELLANQRCIPGETLLFFDEIQECPRAIISLRYFKEKMPKMHVIAAGSLLEFTLADAEFSFPVGRVGFYYLKPLSFKEFLNALGENQFIEYLSKITLKEAQKITLGVHQKGLDLIRQYVVLGGMPQIINNFIETGSFLKARQMQQFLMQSYVQDFGKYASPAQQKYLQRLLLVAPSLIGKQFKYSSVDPEMRSREIKTAVQQLNWAQVLYSVVATKASGLPLRVYINDRKFKLLFLDIGLMNQSFGLEETPILQRDHSLLHWGSLMEQLAGQELLAYQNPLSPPELFYWENEAKSATAEVDYISHYGQKMIPIEVKAGKTGRLKSLSVFLSNHPAPFGVQISENPLAFSNNILSIPFYLIHQLDRLISEMP